ncbi:hypothetical protein BGZ67_009965 [Mortierella alpina]|nr:hypothetical protein BGZ67_009965 [Mortierella alpina]
MSTTLGQASTTRPSATSSRQDLSMRTIGKTLFIQSTIKPGQEPSAQLRQQPIALPTVLSRMEEIITCPVNLKKILRHEIPAPEQDLIITLIKKAQKSITDTISELAALAYKAVILMAAGQFYEEDLELASSTPRTLDTRVILPQGYPIPEGFDPVVHIAPLPHKLQDHLLKNPRGNIFLGVQQAKRRANNVAGFDPATATMIKNHPL